MLWRFCNPAMLLAPDGGGNAGGGTDPAGGTPPPDDKAKPVTMTQEALDTLFAERANRAKEAAIADLLKKAGVEKVDDLVNGFTAHKKAQEAQLSETEKLTKAKADAEAEAQRVKTEADTKIAQANERLLKAAVMAEAMEKGFKKEAVADVMLLIDRSKIVEKDGEFTGVKEAVEAVAKIRPFWLGDTRQNQRGSPVPDPKKPDKTNQQQNAPARKPLSL
jgi:hypothetical protein